MTQSPLDIQLMEFLVRLDPNSWPARMEAACQVFERRYGISLLHSVSGTQYHMTDQKLEERSKYFRKCLRTKRRSFTLLPLGRVGVRLPPDIPVREVSSPVADPVRGSFSS